jgi:hypothetical protein
MLTTTPFRPPLEQQEKRKITTESCVLDIHFGRELYAVDTNVSFGSSVNVAPSQYVYPYIHFCLPHLTRSNQLVLEKAKNCNRSTQQSFSKP